MRPRHPAVVVKRAVAILVNVPRGRTALTVGLLFFGSVSAPAQGLLDWLLGLHHDVQVITNSDVTPVGARLPPVSPENPVYYVAVSAGYRDFGGIIAGDKLPKSQDMIRTVARVLAKEGYLPADDQHPPTQCIIFSWGTLYPMLFSEYPWNLNLPPLQINRSAMLRFLGGSKLGLVSEHPDPWLDSELLPGLTRFNPNAEAIATVARTELYAIMLAGYAFPVARPKPPQLLWRTKISCPATGLVLADTLPTMMSIAGPYIGRDTKAPVWVNASDKFKPDIRIGDLKVEEYIDSGQMPVFDRESLTAKTKAKSGR